MKRVFNIFLGGTQAFLFSLCMPGILNAHPASGIVVDARGNVYFVDSRHAVYEVDTYHKKSTLKRITDGHWLAIDGAGHFAKSSPKYFERLTPLGAIPTLI
ncbi:MAG: hypothetical protein M3Y72_01740 [Acidobacteriota bacterium]|nr:hypothetical protein [Acidobacteriota bacterium]